MNAPMILVYNLEKKKADALRILCLKLNIRVRSVEAAEFAEPIAALARFQPCIGTAFEGEPFRDEMLIMVNFGEKLFNALLQGLRASHIFIPLKAVLTPTNMQWPSTMLHDELLKEHEAMQKARPPKP